MKFCLIPTAGTTHSNNINILLYCRHHLSLELPDFPLPVCPLLPECLLLPVCHLLQAHYRVHQGPAAPLSASLWPRYATLTSNLCNWLLNSVYLNIIRTQTFIVWSFGTCGNVNNKVPQLYTIKVCAHCAWGFTIYKLYQWLPNRNSHFCFVQAQHMWKIFVVIFKV